jgi:transposase
MTPLFPDLPPANPEALPPSPPAGKPRLQTANRQQLFWRPTNLEELLAPDHVARAIWAVVEGLDLSAFTADIRAVEEHEGRPAIDPHLLLAVWLYAFSEGVGSARAVDRLCDQHDAYRWILGGVSVNYHTLSDFRWKHPRALEQLFTDILAGLIHAELVDFEQVAQDGMRVRASAGADSFRRQPTLEQSLAQAEAQVRRLAQELDAPDSSQAARSARQQAAAKRAARERQQRLKKALEELPSIRAARTKDPEEARVSMTDPEARVMKMADGGYRPAYNLQFATDCAHQIILGVDVTNIGNDMGRLLPMLDQLERRFSRLPKEVLVDGGYAAVQAIVDATERGVTVYAPVKKGKQPHEPHPGDPSAVADWRVRMGTDHARDIYPLRAATAECVNALARLRSVTQFRLRGLDKVRPLAFLLAIAHNLFRWRTLMPAAA